MTTKTAADLPIGSEIQGQNTTWTKDRPGRDEPWTSSAGGYYSDARMDQLLVGGAFITFVPAGRGRWLAQEQAARRD